MNEENNNENWHHQRTFDFGDHQFGGYYQPGKLQFKWPEDLNPEEIEKIFEKRAKEVYQKRKEFKDACFHHYHEEQENRKERLQPLSIRVKPHTKKFLKEESTLSPREILELYEDFNNGTESYINSLMEEEKELQEEIEEIQEKLQNAKLFREKLEKIKKEDEE